MKRKLLLTLCALVCMLACAFGLAACSQNGGSNDGINGDPKFLRFTDQDGNNIFDYELNQYFNSDDLQKSIDEADIPFYTLGEGKYSDGTEFSVTKDHINAYITSHDADGTIAKKVLLFETQCPYYTVIIEKIPIEYQITYADLEGAVIDAPQTYNVSTQITLPKPTKEYYRFLGWYIEGGDEGRPVKFIIESLPYGNARDITVHALWDEITYTVIYNGVPKTAEHGNPTKIYQKDGVYSLQPIPSTEAYGFRGWKLNDDKVTSIDPIALYDPSAPYVEENFTLNLTADIDYYDFNVTYLADGKTVSSTTFNYNTFADLTAPPVPKKEHYTGHWSEKVTDFKDYEINAVYEIDKFEVSVQTNIGGYSLPACEYEYGTTYQAIYDQLSYENKKLLGLFSDSECLTKVNADDLILQGGTLYAEWSDIYSITAAADWAKLNDYSSSYFVLENDINFLGEPIPAIEEFYGVLDGQNHTISNFTNLNTSCADTYGLFSENKGTIRDLVISDGTYTVTSNLGSHDKSIGFLCGSNASGGTIDHVQIIDVALQINSHVKETGLYVYRYLTAGILAGTNEGTVQNCELKESVQVEMNTFMHAHSNMRYDDSFVRTYASYGTAVGTNKGTVRNVLSFASLSGNTDRKDSVADGYCAPIIYIYYPLRIGGIAGWNSENGIIERSLSGASLAAHHNATAQKQFFGILDLGGICGLNNGSVDKCVAGNGAILDAYANAETKVGGICGTNDGNGVVKSSYSKAQFVVSNRSAREKTFVGGIAGVNNAAINYCYAIVGSVRFGAFAYDMEDNAVGDFGGLFGLAQASSIVSNSFVKIEAEASGRLTCYDQGKSDGGTLRKSYTYVESAENYQIIDAAVRFTDEAEMLRVIGSLGYHDMGFTVTEGAYPALPDVERE